MRIYKMQASKKKNIEKDNYRRTNRLIAERLPNCKITVNGNPHEGVD